MVSILCISGYRVRICIICECGHWILSPERAVLEMKPVETVSKRRSCLTSQRPAITPGLRNYGADPGRESVERIGF